MAELLDNNFLESLLMKLDDHGHLNDFMMLLKLLQSGEFPMDNIVFNIIVGAHTVPEMPKYCRYEI